MTDQARESLLQDRPRRRLQTNPGPLKIVPQAQRDAWTKQPSDGWLCQHTDGRGRCRSRETKAYPLPERPWVEWLCDRHAPKERSR